MGANANILTTAAITFILYMIFRNRRIVGNLKKSASDLPLDMENTKTRPAKPKSRHFEQLLKPILWVSAVCMMMHRSVVKNFTPDQNGVSRYGDNRSNREQKVQLYTPSSFGDLLKSMQTQQGDAAKIASGKNVLMEMTGYVNNPFLQNIASTLITDLISDDLAKSLASTQQVSNVVKVLSRSVSDGNLASDINDYETGTLDQSRSSVGHNEYVASKSNAPPVATPHVEGKRSSKGEEECRRVLEDIFKAPFPSVRPDWLQNRVTNTCLELDCYNSSYGIACEYNGKQHYSFVPLFHKTKEDLRNQQYRDELKRMMCAELGIKLIQVPYTVPLDKIQQHIMNELQKLGVFNTTNSLKM